MERERARRWVVALATAGCCAAIALAYQARGGPFFRSPATVVDHVVAEEHHLRRTLLLLREVAGAIPPGATVVCVRPVKGIITDETDDYLAAIGLLPRHRVLPPFAAREGVVDYVVAAGGPLGDPRYELLHQSPHGFLYMRRP